MWYINKFLESEFFNYVSEVPRKTKKTQEHRKTSLTMKTHAQGDDKSRNIYKAVTKLDNCGKPGHVVNLNRLKD